MPFYLIISLLLASARQPVHSVDSFEWPRTLSAWHLFDGPLAELNPADGVIYYDVNAPLYSDYAQKDRFIRLPLNQSAQFNSTHAFELPEGTVLVKNFSYYLDERAPAKGRRHLETRLLVLRDGTWRAASYQWNVSQTEAILAIAGNTMDIEWIDKSGKQLELHYLIPDANQCKTCHNQDDVLVPLGITSKQLHNNQTDQLNHWKQNGMLINLPAQPGMLETLADYEDESLSLDQRARAYLDSNCGHCHSKTGTARTSGLNLTIEEKDPHLLGVYKAPVAAGRGSGGRQYSIVPGKPNQSILLFRMESSDPGIRMPEINRQIPHAEGIELIKEWIKEMSE